MTRRTLLLAPFLASAQEQPSVNFPSFRAKSMDGEIYTNDSIKDKPVLIQFWTTWCGVCRGDQSAVDEVTRKYKEKGLLVLAVSVEESADTVKSYLQKSPRAPKIVLTEDTTLVSTLRPRAFPSYVLLNKQGKAVAVQEGGGGLSALQGMLKRVGLD
jgi:thiol-disulfide isomerase/thioredoxin